MTELFTVLENGQLEVNFEALELKTSAEFVEKIQSRIVLSEGKLVLKKIVEREGRIEVIMMFGDSSMSIYTFWNFDSYTTDIEVKTINFQEVRMFKQLGGYVDND